MRILVCLFGMAAALAAAELRGIVRQGGTLAHNAVVTISQGAVRRTALTNEKGEYGFRGVAEGAWMVQVELPGFRTERREQSTTAPPGEWNLQPGLSFERPPAAAAPPRRGPAPPAPPPTPLPAKPKPDRAPPLVTEAQRLSDEKEESKAGATPLADWMAPEIRPLKKSSPYNGSLAGLWNQPGWDARAYSLTGQRLAKPDYHRAQGLAAFGGRDFSLNYKWMRNRSPQTITALVPSAAQRAAAAPNPQAASLAALYPPPNFAGSSLYNFQKMVTNGFHHDEVQSKWQRTARRHTLLGSFSWQSTRTDTEDLFGFLDRTLTGGGNLTAGYRRAYGARAFLRLGAQLSWLENEVTPFFAGRRNLSAALGITGNNQDPINWGPPGLEFSSGIAPLKPPAAVWRRNQTSGLTADGSLTRGKHTLSGGSSFRHQQFNIVGQEEARGVFAFTGDDWAKFRAGRPDTALLAYGNADKYLRGATAELFGNDDWRLHPALTLNLALRWEYWSPLTEKYGRLVNPGGPVQPDRNNLSPRVGLAWRPGPAPVVIRAGYGVFHDAAVYAPVMMRMAQQAPLSRSLRAGASAALPLTLANGLQSAAEAAFFGVDPRFRVGYAHSWQASVQAVLPAEWELLVLYQGTQGTRGQQQSLPGTAPLRAGPDAGPTLLTSNGNSNRQAGNLRLSRRLGGRVSAAINYIWSKSLDNTALGPKGQGATHVAQNWLDLSAERGRSPFDQRHACNGTLEFNSGARTPWRWARDWSWTVQWSAGSGLPLTPQWLAPVPGTGVTTSWRPDSTGAALYAAPEGLHLNPAAYRPPAPGQWGNAGRNSINGPRQIAINTGLSRLFRTKGRLGWELRAEAANVLNNATFPSWNTVVGNAQFGAPMASNPMRMVQVMGRFRF
ncbi:MAG: carboxypeptidase regulatory-like domain-containing protein [Acidobacteriota bacterium]